MNINHSKTALERSLKKIVEGLNGFYRASNLPLFNKYLLGSSKSILLSSFMKHHRKKRVSSKVFLSFLTGAILVINVTQTRLGYENIYPNIQKLNTLRHRFVRFVAKRIHKRHTWLVI